MAASSPFAALLHRAVFLTGLLAVVAGIFGMHVVPGAHTVPAAASAGTDMALTQIQGSHLGHPAPQSPASDTPEAAVSGTASPYTAPTHPYASPYTHASATAPDAV
jgi:hypothetical protein